jgi:hypothetical protein
MLSVNAYGRGSGCTSFESQPGDYHELKFQLFSSNVIITDAVKYLRRSWKFPGATLTRGMKSGRILQ